VNPLSLDPYNLPAKSISHDGFDLRKAIEKLENNYTFIWKSLEVHSQSWVSLECLCGAIYNMVANCFC
jgi:hypothetical protein